MLSIGRLGAGQERYYLDKVAEGAEDYYSGEGEVSGYWAGDAAEELGLAGRVEADQLTAMLTARNPADGESLGMRAVGGKGAVPGFDLAFSAPKSVSLLWALGGYQAAIEVNEAHRHSVAAALDYMQRQACWTRRGAGGHEFLHGNGFLAAAFEHRSSRAGDPQLHTHVLIANATKGPDGRWTRLYHPAIFDHAKTAGYIYEANLRHELSQRLGVQWQPVRNGIAEIEGFADSHLREFSKRREEILEAAGPEASARARQVATLATRKVKEKGVSPEDLCQRWRTEAREIGLDRESIERTFDTEAFRRVLDPDTLAVARTVSAWQVDRAVTAGVSHFDRREAIQAVADLLPSGAPAAEVERMADAFLASDSVIRIGESPQGERFTTRRIWELEQAALAAAERMRTEGTTPAGELIAARAIHARPTLKDDQREMVRRLLGEREGLSIVIGEAGSGKSFAIVAAAEGWARAGIELRAAAPTWRAANVLRCEGLPATSVASLLAELDRAAQDAGEAMPRGSVLLIDEAGMVDSATLARLISHAEAAEAKLVLLGDPEQLQEIEAGGLFRALAERGEPIYLDEVIRHRHDLDREAAKCIRDGHGTEALDLYRSEERVIVAPNAEARREAMVADWHQSFDLGEDTVMIAKRNVEVERLNELARAVRKDAGKLGAGEIEVGGQPFAAGDQVITRVNDRQANIYNRERWRVAEVDVEARSVVLDGIDARRRVCVDAVYLERLNPYNDAPALEHAYALTTYSAQGTTVERAVVMADPSMDKQELYVAASRARGETYLYATPEIQAQREEIAPRSPYLREGLEHIAEAAERDRAQIAAHDIALRAELERLPTSILAQRRGELLPRAHREASAERLRDRRQDGAADTEQNIDRAARQELGAVESVLSKRAQLAVTAAHLAPPPYITKELGERPSDPTKRKSWEQGVRQIEGYRQEHGVKDRDRAFGAKPREPAERAARDRAQRQLQRLQRDLGGEKQVGRSRDSGRSLGMGR